MRAGPCMPCWRYDPRCRSWSLPAVSQGPIAIVLMFAALVLGTSKAQARQCEIRISTQEDHSGLAQQVIVRVERAVDASALLASATHEDKYDVEFRLVSASPDYRTAGASQTPFRLYYLVLGRREVVLFAEVLRCPDGADDCVLSVLRQLGEACGGLPAARWTEKPRKTG